MGDACTFELFLVFTFGGDWLDVSVTFFGVVVVGLTVVVVVVCVGRCVVVVVGVIILTVVDE